MEGRVMIGRGIILNAFLLIPLPNIPLPNFLELGCGWLAICENQSFSTKFVRGIMVRGMRGSEIILRSPFPIPLTIIPLTPLRFSVFQAHHRLGCGSAALGFLIVCSCVPIQRW
jgi:hypothetical protein